MLIRFDDERRLPREFEDLVVVAAASGAEVRLGDIATITDRFELDEEKSLFNGERAALPGDREEQRRRHPRRGRRAQRLP